MMATTAKGRDFWEQHLAGLRASGLSAAAYAREHGVSVHALGWWRRKVNASALAKPGSAQPSTKASKFVALKVAEPVMVRPMGVTLAIGSEVRLQMNELPAPAWLAAVDQAMRGVR
jgi:transposase-like protein